jgi:hypothetical protein
MVLPGLHDNHIHLLGTVALPMCDLDGPEASISISWLPRSRRVCPHAAQPGEWLVVNQWSPYDGNTPTASHTTPGRPGCRGTGQSGGAARGGRSRQCLQLARHWPAPKIRMAIRWASTPPHWRRAGFERFIPYVDLTSGVIREGARSAIPVPDSGAERHDERAAAQYDKILPAISS